MAQPFIPEVVLPFFNSLQIVWHRLRYSAEDKDLFMFALCENTEPLSYRLHEWKKYFAGILI